MVVGVFIWLCDGLVNCPDRDPSPHLMSAGVGYSSHHDPEKNPAEDETRSCELVQRSSQSLRCRFTLNIHQFKFWKYLFYIKSIILVVASTGCTAQHWCHVFAPFFDKDRLRLELGSDSATDAVLDATLHIYPGMDGAGGGRTQITESTPVAGCDENVLPRGTVAAGQQMLVSNPQPLVWTLRRFTVTVEYLKHKKENNDNNYVGGCMV